MTKHAKKTEPLQLVDRRKTATVRIPVPFLDVLASIEHSFFDLCIAAGRQVLDAMMEQDREALCGPRSRRDPDRRAGRAGTTTSEVTLGGRRIRIPRPRVRSTAGEELALPSYVFAAQRDPLDNHTLNAVACGISTRRYARSLEPLTEDLDERSTSKSAVSRRYVALSTQRMTAWLTTPLGDRSPGVGSSGPSASRSQSRSRASSRQYATAPRKLAPLRWSLLITSVLRLRQQLQEQRPQPLERDPRPFRKQAALMQAAGDLVHVHREPRHLAELGRGQPPRRGHPQPLAQRALPKVVRHSQPRRRRPPPQLDQLGVA